jgi:hypothetical protein
MTTDNTPPEWCDPNATGDWQDLTTGDTIHTWEQPLNHDVWLACEDHTIEGHTFRTPARIHVGQQPTDGLTTHQARALAAQLLHAANLID